MPVVTVLYSGRPIPANDLINRSDAFVAAWLPGTEGQGLPTCSLPDRTAARPPTSPAGSRSTGRLATAYRSRAGVQFRRGYGLSSSSANRLGRLPEAPVTLACPAESR